MFFIFNVCGFSSHVLILLIFIVFHFCLWAGGISNKKQSTVLLVSYLQGLVGGAGNLILCFHDGFCFIFYVLGKKLTGSFLFFIGNIFTVLFAGFVFGKSRLHSRGSFNLACFGLLGDYIGSGLLFSVFVCFREDTTCSFFVSRFLFRYFWW